MTQSSGISRRNFLQGLAAGAVGAGAFGLAGCAPATRSAGGAADGEAASANGGSAQGATAGNTGALNPQDYDYTANSIADFASSALFSGWKLGGIQLNHRMVKSAAFQLAFMKGNPDEYIGYYERMAQGGVCLALCKVRAGLGRDLADPAVVLGERIALAGLPVEWRLAGQVGLQPLQLGQQPPGQDEQAHDFD